MQHFVWLMIRCCVAGAVLIWAPLCFLVWAWWPYYATRAHIRLGVYRASVFCLSVRSSRRWGLWKAKDIAAAIRDVLMYGVSKETAAKRNNCVPRGTLQRHVEMHRKSKDSTKYAYCNAEYDAENDKGRGWWLA